MANTFIIKEEVLNEVANIMKPTESQFNSNMRYFLHQLISDPVHAEIPTCIRMANISRSRFIKMLIDRGIVSRSERLNDTNKDGTYKTPTMAVKYTIIDKIPDESEYKVSKTDFDRRIEKLRRSIFEKNLPQKKFNSPLGDELAITKNSPLTMGFIAPGEKKHDTVSWMQNRAAEALNANLVLREESSYNPKDDNPRKESEKFTDEENEIVRIVNKEIEKTHLPKDEEKEHYDTYAIRWAEFYYDDIVKTFAMNVFGGFNGGGDWFDYFKVLADFCKRLEEQGIRVFLIDAQNDCADDVYDMQFGLQKKNDELNEEGGATSADASGAFVQPLFKKIVRRQIKEILERLTPDTEISSRYRNLGGGFDVKLEDGTFEKSLVTIQNKSTKTLYHICFDGATFNVFRDMGDGMPCTHMSYVFDKLINTMNQDGYVNVNESTMSNGRVFRISEEQYKQIEETTSTMNVGGPKADYQYTVPFPVDGNDETMQRHNGEGGSISINHIRESKNYANMDVDARDGGRHAVKMNTQENNGEPDGGKEMNEVVRKILNKFAIPYILNESQLLLEADDRLKKVAHTIEHEFNGLLDPTAPVRGSEYYVNNNPNTTWMDYLMFSLRHTFGLMSNQDVKYLPLVANLAFSDEVGFEKRNDNGTEIAQLQKIVSLLKTNAELFNSLNKVKDTVSFSQVCEQLKPQLQAIAQSDADNAENVAVNDSYDIVEITSYEQAHEIGNHSCSSSRLCYTQSPDTWNSYTRNGINRPYVCLRKGWENIPEVAGDGNPYDEYGTSMIFVFIDPEGNIAFSNCRWSHSNTNPYMNGGDVDHAFTKTSLAQTVGRPFTSVFKPYPMDYLMERGYVPFNMVQTMLNNGTDPRKLFADIDDFYKGLAVVQLNGKFNWLRQDNGQLLSNQWFDRFSGFREGLARVKLNGKENWLRQDNGQLLSNQWFDRCGNFNEGLACVRLNDKSNWIRQDNGQLLSDQWFDECSIFNGGLATVRLNTKWYYMRKDGVLCDYSTKKPIQQQPMLNENETKENFFEKHGIKEVSCGLGYSEKEEKWYGWSHRAIHGFGIGDKCVECYPTGTKQGKIIKTMEQAKEAAKKFADSVS